MERRRGWIYRLSLGLLYFSIIFNLSAQECNFQWYDYKSYQLYEAQRWDELIDLGKQALRRDYDYFYLRMRLGRAYYQQKRYRRAAHQYYKALGFSNRDPDALRMLSYSLLYGGQVQEAWLIRRRWPGESPPFFQIQTIGGEAGVRTTREELPIRQLELANAGFSHQLGGHLSLQYRYFFLRQHFQNEEIIIRPPHGGGPPRPFLQRSETTIDQHEYRIGADFQFRRGWKLYGAYHPLWYTDTLGTFNEQVFAFGISKDWPLLQLAGHLGFLDLTAQSFRQYQLQATVYPLGNTHLYYRAAATLKDGYEPAPFENNHWFSQQLGFRLFDNAWLEGQYAFGRTATFFEGPATLVYNLPDPIEQRFGGSFQYWINGRHLLYIYVLQENKIYAAENVPYRQFTVLGGLRLTFGSF